MTISRRLLPVLFLLFLAGYAPVFAAFRAGILVMVAALVWATLTIVRGREESKGGTGAKPLPVARL